MELGLLFVVLQQHRDARQGTHQAEGQVPQTQHLRRVDGEVALGVDGRVEELQVEGVRRRREVARLRRECGGEERDGGQGRHEGTTGHS